MAMLLHPVSKTLEGPRCKSWFPHLCEFQPWIFRKAIVPIREFKVQKGFHDLPTSFQPLLIPQEIFWIVSLKRLFVSDMSNTFNHGTYKDCHHRMNSICNHHVDYRLCQSKCTLGRRWMELWEDEIEPPEIMAFFLPKKEVLFAGIHVFRFNECNMWTTINSSYRFHPPNAATPHQTKTLLKADWSNMIVLQGLKILKNISAAVYSSQPNYLDVSKNRGTPKWMVYNGKPY